MINLVIQDKKSDNNLDESIKKSTLTNRNTSEDMSPFYFVDPPDVTLFYEAKENNNKDRSSKLIINLIIVLLLCILSFFTYLLLLAFGVIGLVISNDIISNIWYYLLISIILLVCSITITLFSCKEDNYFFKKIIIIIVFYIGNIIWGGYELFNFNSMSSLNRTMLYKIALAYWILSLFIVSISIGYLIYNMKILVVNEKPNMRSEILWICKENPQHIDRCLETGLDHTEKNIIEAH